MDKYKVLINQKAIKDLDSIYEYIAKEKFSPKNARGQADRIKEAILKLDTFPQSHQRRLEGRYAEKGYRQLAIFRINDAEKTVTVVTVQYQRRDI